MRSASGESGLSFRESMPCPYFDDGRTATIEYLYDGDAGQDDFERFLAEGRRRLGSVFYRNVCSGCSACVPTRVDVGRFSPGRSQRRTLRRNTDIRVRCFSPAFLSAAKVELYRRYLLSKHGEKDQEGQDHEKHLSYIHYGFSHVIEMDYFLGDRLVGVGIVDESSKGLSANYFYYDTEFPKRRLGIFSMLQEIALALQMGKQYQYLGFCIDENPKMSYKKAFGPNQVLCGGKWISTEEDGAAE